MGPTGVALLAKTLKFDKKAAARKAAQNPTIVMKKPVRLWELHVGGNYFGDDASADMAEMLEQMDTLEKIDISTNNIKHGFRALIPSLKKISKNLRMLNISGNQSINKGIRYLLELINECPNLESINISDVNMKK